MILSEDAILAATKVVPAIYKITNIINGKFYIGSTKNYCERRTRHFSDLRHNRHSNSRLQQAFNKYGEDKFKIEMLTPATPDELIWMEQNFIDWLDASNRHIGYNISSVAAYPSTQRSPLTAEHKAKIAESNRGQKRSLETCQKLSESHKRLFASGYVHPRKGKKLSGIELAQYRDISKKLCKPVIRVGNQTEIFFSSLKDAELKTPRANAWCISRCCRGLAKKAGGYTWRWAK